MANQNLNPHEFDIPPTEPEPTNTLAGVQPFVNPQGKSNQTPNELPSKQSLPQQQPNIHSINTVNAMSQPPSKTPPESEKKRKAREKLNKIRKHKHYGTVRFAIISFFVFLIIFNFQFIYSQVLFYLIPKPTSTQVQQNQTNQQTTQSQTTNQTQPAAEVVGPENVLIIPKLNVKAPIIYMNTLDEREILRSLQDGVVHYAGTANPGENGNAVFFGHSSNDWWQPGNYKFVFVLLEKLVPGDTYEIHYQSRRYVYKVTSTKVVAPTDLSVLAQTNTPTSTLITCTPPGTSWRRFVAHADQIEPAPNAQPVQQANTQQSSTASTTTVNSTQSGTLPGASASIFNQIQAFFSSLFTRFFGGSNNNQQPDSQPQSSANTNHLPDVK